MARISRRGQQHHIRRETPSQVEREGGRCLAGFPGRVCSHQIPQSVLETSIPLLELLDFRRVGSP